MNTQESMSYAVQVHKGDIIRVNLDTGESACLLVGDSRGDDGTVRVYFLYPMGDFSVDDTRCGLKGMVMFGQFLDGDMVVTMRSMDVIDAAAHDLPSHVFVAGTEVIGQIVHDDIWSTLHMAESDADDIPTAFLPARRRMRQAAERFIANMIALSAQSIS